MSTGGSTASLRDAMVVHLRLAPSEG